MTRRIIIIINIKVFLYKQIMKSHFNFWLAKHAKEILLLKEFVIYQPQQLKHFSKE